jgi:predicted nuclease of predicted toxin-antitoxin system
MNFVADESCAGPVIQALRAAGHDVVAIAEVAKGTPDEQVLERALREKRVLITEDHDFGELVYARGRASAGVMLVRFHSRARRAKPASVVEAVAKLGLRLQDCFALSSPAACAWAEGQQADPGGIRSVEGSIESARRAGWPRPGGPAVDHAGSVRPLSCQELGRRRGLSGMILE